MDHAGQSRCMRHLWHAATARLEDIYEEEQKTQMLIWAYLYAKLASTAWLLFCASSLVVSQQDHMHQARKYNENLYVSSRPRKCNSPQTSVKEKKRSARTVQRLAPMHDDGLWPR